MKNTLALILALFLCVLPALAQEPHLPLGSVVPGVGQNVGVDLGAGKEVLHGAILPAANGGTGLSTSGTDSTKVLGSDGAGGFHMVSSGGSSTWTHLTGTITSTELKSLNASPKTLLAAQGANSYIEVGDAVAEYIYGTTPYTGGAPICFGVGGNNVSQIFGATNIQGSGSLFTSLNCQLFSTFDPTTYFNGALTIFNQGGPEFAGGDGTIKYDITYRVVQF